MVSAMAQRSEQILESRKAALARRRLMVLELEPGESTTIYGIHIKAASNIIAWVKDERPNRQFESQTIHRGVTIWRVK
jgi:hypothetical protein